LAPFFGEIRHEAAWIAIGMLSLAYGATNSPISATESCHKSLKRKAFTIVAIVSKVSIESFMKGKALFIFFTLSDDLHFALDS
jgi:hypothetical protein